MFRILEGDKKILDWLGIDEFRRGRQQKKLSAADLFDDFAQNDHIGCDMGIFNRGVTTSSTRYMPKTS